MAKGTSCFRVWVILMILMVLVGSSGWVGESHSKNIVVGQAPVVSDVTAPTLSGNPVIGTNGTSWTFGYSEAVTCASTANCCDDFTAAMTTAGAITLSYASGSGSNSVVCTGSPTVNSGDTVANGGIDYTTVANGIEDAAGNDMASFTNQAITNNSTQGGYEIEDLFGSDTSANYTKILDIQGTGSLSISGGTCTVTASTASRWFHETALSSVSHYVQATVVVSAGGDHTGILARSDGTSGATADYYYVYYEDGGWSLYRTNNGSATYLNWIAAATGARTLRMEVSGTGATVNIKVIDGGTTIIDHDDTDAGRLTAGSYVGLAFKNDNSNNPTVDNLIADNL